MLLTPEDLGVSEATLRTAEALVAAHLGTTTLKARAVTQTGYLDGQVLTLREGPASNLGAMLFNGVALQLNPIYPGPRLTPWALDFQPYYSRFALGLGGAGFGWSGYPYSVTYIAGYTESSAPEALKVAVLLTCQHLDAMAGFTPGLTAEKIGDTSASYGGGIQIGLPPAVVQLLAPFARIRF